MKTLKDGVEYFDGEPVSLYEGRLSGSFSIDEDGASLSHGDLVTFVVTARVESPKFSHLKSTGELKRVNSMKVQEVVQLTPDKARYLLDLLGRKMNGVNDGIIEDAVEDFSVAPSSEFMYQSFVEVS